MDEVQQATLYIVTQGAYLHRDGQAIVIEIDSKPVHRLPMHLIESIACFGRVMVSPQLMEACAEALIPIHFLSEHGRMLARVEVPGAGGVRIRRAQYRRADDAAFKLATARAMVAGKIQNARGSLLRSARDLPETAGESAAALRVAAELLGVAIERTALAATLDELRGLEGDAARVYFGHFSRMTPNAPGGLRFGKRTRRPPLDAVNALLSLFYSICTHDCAAALAMAGLDPSIGFLHEERAGRPSLALDLVEEFRAFLVDRFVITLINRKGQCKNNFVFFGEKGGMIVLVNGLTRSIRRCRKHPFTVVNVRFVKNHSRTRINNYTVV